MVERSDTLSESLLCLRSSEGFRVIMTNTESIEIMETTTRSSMRVKPFLSLFIALLYHGEGGVNPHTKRVLDALRRFFKSTRSGVGVKPESFRIKIG